MELVALISSGKGSWAQVSGLMKHGEWDNVILIGDSFSKKFASEMKFDFVEVDLDRKILDLKDEIIKNHDSRILKNQEGKGNVAG